MAEPLQTQVRKAFADSLRLIWWASLALCILALLCVLGVKEIRMHEVTDENWGMQEVKKEGEALAQRA